MKSFESLASFATDDRLYRLVAKERGKYAAKSNGKDDAFKSDRLFQALKGMTPPHRLWSDPGRGKLPRKADRGIAKWTGKKRRAAVRVYQAIRKYHDRLPDALNALANPGSAKELLAHVKERVRDFVDSAPQSDDLTMLCLEYKGSNNL